jgi:hypothetical protein
LPPQVLREIEEMLERAAAGELFFHLCWQTLLQKKKKETLVSLATSKDGQVQN